MEQLIYRVGTCKMAIPWPDDFFPYHSWGPRRLTGIHDDLCVRVVYLCEPGELLMVSVENGDIDPLWASKLAEISGVSEEKILISVTHTHTAPYIGGYWPEDVEDVEKSERYAANAWDTVVKAVESAMSQTEPAELRFGVGSCDVNVNRDVTVTDVKTGKVSCRMGKNVHGYSDKSVPVMYFVREDGTIAAVVFGCSVHSSILFGTDMKDGGQLASGDLAGCASQYVENRLGHGAVAMFTMAPAADQNARHIATFQTVDENGKPRGGNYGTASYVVVDLLGRELSEEVLRVCGQEGHSCGAESIRTAARTIWVPGKVKKEDPGQEPESPADYRPADPVPLYLAVTAIGTLAMVGIGCETSSGNVPRIRQIMQEKGFEDMLVITQCNGSSSYMSDQLGYQAVTFSAKASHMMPEAVDRMFDALEELAGQAMSSDNENKEERDG